MDKKTVVVCGFAHSGTTMLTGIFEQLGVPMVGDDYLRMSWEDQEIRWALKGSDEELQALVQRRNADHDVWGFKHVGAHAHLRRLNRILRNPIFFAILKDPVSVTQRRIGDRSAPFMGELRLTCDRISRFVVRLDEADIQVHTLSYTHAITKPGLFVDDVIKRSGLGVTRKRRQGAIEFISPNTTDNWRQPYRQVVRP
jgi:hypothetical protein